jgi:hypothetical protein
MTRPFGYVGIEHVSFRFTAPHARTPLNSWSTWSPRLVTLVVTRFFVSTMQEHAHTLDTSPLPPSQRRVGRTHPITMPFGYVKDGCVIVAFTAPHVQAPFDSWLTAVM